MFIMRLEFYRSVGKVMGLDWEPGFFFFVLSTLFFLVCLTCLFFVSSDVVECVSVTGLFVLVLSLHFFCFWLYLSSISFASIDNSSTNL